ncbi:MAG: hypothetical protein CBARDCOR_6428 [uncultured Caballeronia sp.]|nr:MAG: hypothetical protein CBARDCOR_6428 [uncultured Caballeronia sp.]
MDTLLATAQTPTFYQWLCIAIITCAMATPKGLIVIDRMLARQPERSERSGRSYIPHVQDATQPSIWPRVTTAIGSAFWIAALLTLVLLCWQLAP